MKCFWALCALISAAACSDGKSAPDPSANDVATAAGSDGVIVKCLGTGRTKMSGSIFAGMSDEQKDQPATAYFVINDKTKTFEVQNDLDNDEFSDVCRDTKICDVSVNPSKVEWQTTEETKEATTIFTGWISRSEGVAGASATVIYHRDGEEVGRQSYDWTYHQCAKSGAPSAKF